MNDSATMYFALIRACRPFAVFRLVLTTCVVFSIRYGSMVLISRSSSRSRIAISGSFPPLTSLELKENDRTTGCHFILYRRQFHYSRRHFITYRNKCVVFPSLKRCSSLFRILIASEILSPSISVPNLLPSSRNINSGLVCTNDCSCQ